MKNLVSVSGVALLAMSLGFIACSTQEEMARQAGGETCCAGTRGSGKDRSKSRS